MRPLTIFVLLLTTCSVANAAEYQGYVPKSLAEMGETWSGADAAGILACKRLSPRDLNASLSKDAAHKWYEMCAKANIVHSQLVSGNCFQVQSVANCRTAISADNAIRRNPEFWHILNALRGRADEYGLDG